MSLKTIENFVAQEKISSRIHQKCLNNFFWPKTFTTNTLCVNVYKIYECDKNPNALLQCKKFQKINVLGIFRH
jgi:hypothetical protein